MRAVVLQEPRKVAVVDVPDPEPGPDEPVLLRMHAVGICGSDLHTYRGDHPFRKPPVVLGHEGAGEVIVAAGPFDAGDRVAVLGGGTIGSLVAAVCRLRGAGPLLVSDVKPYNRRFLHSIGIEHVVDPSELLATGDRLTVGEGFDVVVVASGHPGCLTEALALCRPRGRVVLLPMFAGALSADLNPVVLKEVTVQGSTIYTPADFRAAARLVNTRALDVRPFVTEVAPLDRAPELLEAIDAGGDHLKIQFDPTR